MEKDAGKGGKIVFIDTFSNSYTEQTVHRETRHLKTELQKVSYSVCMQFRCLKDNIYKIFRTVPRAY